MKATLYSDGGARGNPGPAGIGFVLAIETGSAIEAGEYIGETTNNQAEYQALIAGLTRAQQEGVKELTCYLDSELVVKQMTGEYRVKEPTLKPLHENVRGLAALFERISFAHVPREKNKVADRLVNQAIDRNPDKR